MASRGAGSRSSRSSSTSSLSHEHDEANQEAAVEIEAEGDEAHDDPLNIYDTGLSNLFSIPPIAFSTTSPTSLYIYGPPPAARTQTPIRLRVPTPGASVFNKLQANHVWLSALYLADQITTGEVQLGSRVLELGAGAGLPGIAACLLGCDVLSTDWGDEDILACLESNFNRNCETKSAGHWAAMSHEWGSDPIKLLAFGSHPSGEDKAVSNIGSHDPKPKRFDTLLLADTLWVSSAHSVLLDSIQALLAPKGMAHIAAGLHTGRWPVESFIKQAEERGAHIERVREVRWAGAGQWEVMDQADDA
ncbi:hypothetical protein BD324DRAFT_370912 [Kockovaella imperatae]|uniref:Methyltransferase-domain-containing protein n=1 Tax=Kockovaella imperatae TaxID=4999 RepID=A0A1Y1UKN7_9TREE|nr:hypothetical protein BD324DRAFT_370912 [Kockovaella imperatae]ORX38621.1 hypothetical protein BD324DRAFT_370912 [Kockovaella imperatae]